MEREGKAKRKKKLKSKGVFATSHLLCSVIYLLKKKKRHTALVRTFKKYFSLLQKKYVLARNNKKKEIRKY